MTDQEIQYALAKQVPDMVRGFTISTSYGDITIPAGQLAECISNEVWIALQRELMAFGKDASQ